MKSINIQDQIEPINDKVQKTENQVMDYQIVYSKSSNMTAPNTDAPTISINDNAIVNNMRTRILELENALVKARIIKSR